MDREMLNSVNFWRAIPQSVCVRDKRAQLLQKRRSNRRVSFFFVIDFRNQIAGGDIQRYTPQKGKRVGYGLYARIKKEPQLLLPASVAAPIAAVAASAFPDERPEASMIEATVNPSGILWSRIAMNTRSPTLKSTRKADAIETPSKTLDQSPPKLCMAADGRMKDSGWFGADMKVRSESVCSNN